MKVYVISESVYGEHSICQIFLNKTQAEQYMKLHENTTYILTMEEYETFDDKINLTKYQQISYITIDYRQYYSSNESIDMNVKTTNTLQSSNMNQYPYFWHNYAHFDKCYSIQHQIRLHYPNPHNLPLSTILKNKDKYLKICRDYVAKAKSLHDEGVDWNSINQILFK